MAQIDWNDFVIVETIDLLEDDMSLPQQPLLQPTPEQDEMY